MTKSAQGDGRQRLARCVMDRHRLTVAIPFVVVAAVHLFTLMRFPPVFVDEGWQASRAWALLHTGRAFGSLDPGVLKQFECYWAFYPWLPSALQALSLRTADSPSLFPMRLLSLFFGLLLLGAIYAIGRHLYGRNTALLAVLLVAVSWPFSNSAHIARVDVMAAAFGFTAVALYLHSRPPRWWMNLLSGLCVGLAFEIHPHAALYGVTIVALYFLHRRWTALREATFWGFVAGAGAGLVCYAVFHILPSPQTYWKTGGLIFGPGYTPPILQPNVIASSIVDMGRLLFSLYPLLMPLIVWATLVLVKERSREAMTLIVLSGVLLGAAVLLMRSKMLYSAILFTPTIDLMVAALIAAVGRQPWRGLPLDYIRRTLVWGIALGSVAVNLFLLLRYDFWEAYRDVERRVMGIVQQGDSVMAPQTYWFGLYDHEYYSWQELVWYRRYDPSMSPNDVLQRLRPDVLILDGSWDYFISDEPGDDMRYASLWIPRSEMETFLDTHASLIAEFDSGYWGLVRAYRITWEEK